MDRSQRGRPSESAIERRFSALEQRLSRLEARLAGSVDQHANLESQTAIEEVPANGSRGAEYWIGAKLVPRLGAVLIILAIAFVAVSESSKNPTFDRGILLGAEALFCLAFIAFGEWKRNEMEGFGPTLSAIGSCGLYLAAAGGHFAYHTLTAAGMATVFAGLTLLNHGFALWRSTRLFFFIGASGGLAAMLFPLTEKDYGTALAVYVAVTVGGAIVCALRKWLHLALVGWFLSLVIIAPIIDSDFSRASVIISLYVASLACIWAIVRSSSAESVDPIALLGPLAFFATGVVGFWVLHETAGIAHLVALSISGAVVSLAVPRVSYSRKAMLVGSVAVGALLGPLCFPLGTASLIYSGLAVLASFFGRFVFRKLLSVFGVAGFIAAGSAYLGSTSQAGVSVQNLGLLALLVALISSSIALRSAGYGWIGYLVSFLWVILMRACALMGSGQSVGAGTFSYLTIASVFYALALLVLGFRMHSSNLRLWSFVVMLGSVFQILLLDSETAIGFRILALVSIGAMMLIGGYRYLKDQRTSITT